MNHSTGLLLLALSSVLLTCVVTIYYAIEKRKRVKELSKMLTTANEIADYLKKEGMDTKIMVEQAQSTDLINTKSLTELLTTEPTEADYQLFIHVLAEVIQQEYKNYRFLRQDPSPTDKLSGHCLIFNIHRDLNLSSFNRLFKLTVDRGLKDIDIHNYFVDAVVNGKILDLGGAVIVQDETGVSSILQGDSIRVIITFMTADYAKERQEQLDIMREKQEEAENEQKEKLELAKQLQEARTKAYAEIESATTILKLLNEKAIDTYGLAEDIKKLKEEITTLQNGVD